MRNMGVRVHPFLACLSMFFVVLALAACGGTGTPAFTPFALPTGLSDPAPLMQATSQLLADTATPPCTNSLLFLQDLTIPDNTAVAAGSSLDKQWQVQNNGSCNWDSHYRLRLVGGDALGVPPEQALYPARSGAQVVLRIIFTAPTASGAYTSEWQAFDPQGNAFGDAFFIKIVVTP